MADGKAANGPVLHSLSMIQDNVHHPVSDPRAADILRKKPEQEDFVRVNVAPLGEWKGSQSCVSCVLALHSTLGEWSGGIPWAQICSVLFERVSNPYSLA